MQVPLTEKWIERLALSYRQPPEFFQSSDEVLDVPHAGALRDAFDKIGLSAVLCVQGVPTITFITQENYDRESVIEAHAALWNQGLANLLLVISGDTLRAFSLARRTVQNSAEDFERRCLIDVLDAVSHSLALKDLVTGAESGRLWKEHNEFFPPQERIDTVLLGNLIESHKRLCEWLSPDASQALLMQTMFIAYLEDREIIKEDYIREATSNAVNSFSALLESGNTKLLIQLFEVLRHHFNGDLFVAPCSFEVSKNVPPLNKAHLSVLSSFRLGTEEIHERGSQLRFWGYDFRYIPVELISAVYDRFLGENDEERRKLGAYYTPMFLADTVISQVWDTLPLATKDKGTFLDPACGSGIFLVRSFQRLCEQWRITHPDQTIRWDSLCKILERLHGWDINGSAVRVAVFSLYIALLEQLLEHVNPPNIRAMIRRGRILPELWGKTLIEQDFFSVSSEERQSYDVIIGNPPWTSRRGSERQAVKWCSKHGFPMPSEEEAWGFAWKALAHIAPQGLIAFLLPAMGFLHNHSDVAITARKRFIRETHIVQVINFADLRFQLFSGVSLPSGRGRKSDGPHKAAALLLFQRAKSDNKPYKFEYWVPKADLNLRLKRFITLSSIDKTWLGSDEILKDDLAFKHRLWMRGPDTKLFQYLASLPKLSGFIKIYGDLKRQKISMDNIWVIGQGFQRITEHDIEKDKNTARESSYVTKYPFLSMEDYHRLTLPEISTDPWESAEVRRLGFEEAFTGPRILIPRGVQTSQTRLQASYTEQNVTFLSIIQAIKVPEGEEETAKLLTALLNSRVAVWFAFHGTASFGSDRPEVQQAELLRLPFPRVDDLPEPKRAQKAVENLVKIIDNLLSESEYLLVSDNYEQEILSRIDKLAYDYFCLSEDEIAIIEDTVDYIIPAMQPHEGASPDLWNFARTDDRKVYASMLSKTLGDWLSEGWTVNASFEAGNADLGILRLCLVPAEEARPYEEHADKSLGDVLQRLWKHIRNPLTGNFQILPDFRVFIDNNLYLVKPTQRRFWLRSTALADADIIAADLQDTLTLSKNTVRANASR